MSARLSCAWLAGVLLVGAVALPAWPVCAQAAKPTVEGKTLDAWLAELDDPDPVTRFKAAQSLGKVGADGKRALPALSLAQKDKIGLVAKAADASVKQINAALAGGATAKSDTPKTEPKTSTPTKTETPANPDTPTVATTGSAKLDALIEKLRSGTETEKSRPRRASSCSAKTELTRLRCW